jgi:hypothetical protein
MKTFEKLIEAIDEKMLEVGKDNIDYSSEKDDRFYYNCSSFIESKNHIIYFEFDAYDCGTGFHVNNIKFEDIWLPNIINKLNKTTFKYEA